MSSSTPLDTRAGAKLYSPWVLKVYDVWVLGFSNSWAWRCPTNSVLLPFYRQHLGARHLDVGVGTGFYLKHGDFNAKQKIALLDLNQNSLHAARDRSGRDDVECFQQDIMQPLTKLQGKQYDSISLFYLLHCLPGDMTDKACVFEHLKPHLAEGGVVYGATILGDAVGHNALGRKLMNVYNQKGIFGNRKDTYEGLNQALREHFDEVEIRQQGKVALFVARKLRL